MPKPKEFIFSITNRCNLNCRMCDIPEHPLEELTTNEMKQVIKDAAGLGFSTFVFSGGEPLLRSDIFNLISFAKANHLNVCLISNGCLIDEKVTLSLSRAGIDVVNISIDGPRSVHDYLRGKNTFDKAISAIGYLRKYAVEVTLATMVCGQNYRHLRDILEIAHRHKASTVKFQPFSDIFVNNKSRAKEFLINKEDLSEAIGIFEDLVKLSKRYDIATNPEQYLKLIPFYLSGEKVAPKNGCNALWSTCSINARGDVFPCWVFNNANTLIGNLKDESLLNLWNSAKHDMIRDSIIKSGCPGCMMSCYDETFGKAGQRIDFAKKIRKIDKKLYSRLKNRCIQNIRGAGSQLKRRFRFYKSYRGPFRNVLIRLLAKAKRRSEIKNRCASDEIGEALKEIRLAKQKLEKELLKYR